PTSVQIGQVDAWRRRTRSQSVAFKPAATRGSLDGDSWHLPLESLEANQNLPVAARDLNRDRKQGEDRDDGDSQRGDLDELLRHDLEPVPVGGPELALARQAGRRPLGEEVHRGRVP